ncbi:suppressor of loss of ypt1 [Linnemannia schmuckeri]|uniref:Suppressor of loss of ypt1 n=1 Tax=Linnemannia schmuckeri TaxID=64567 RepID=A0A9P5S4E8_9FUNG|nr:suppressor of loss of ypt1 [Linnemannia schmuckeri]
MANTAGPSSSTRQSGPFSYKPQPTSSTTDNDRIPTADALFEALASQNHNHSTAAALTPSAVHDDDSAIPFFEQQTHDSLPSSIENPLMVHVQQLPTPRTSFSSGASSPPENLSPSSHSSTNHNHSHSHSHSQHHHNTYQFASMTPTSLASSAVSSTSSTPAPTFQSTFASSSSSSSATGSVSGSGPIPSSTLPLAKSPLSVSHLYQPQTYPALRSTSPALNPTIGPSLYDATGVPSLASSGSASVTTTYNTQYSGSSSHTISTSSTLGGRWPAQNQQPLYDQQPLYHHQQQQHQHQYQQEHLYFEDDEKELQKKLNRPALNGVAAYLPPALNQGLSKVVQSAQAVVSSNGGKLSLPSSRPLDGVSSSGFSAGTSASVDPSSLRGMAMKFYKASKLPGLCLLWYFSSAVTNNIGKQIMNQFRYPITLTFVQFVFVSFFCFLLGTGFRMTTIRRPTMGIIQMTAPLVGFQVVGHVFSSFAISRVPLSVVHTIKALSPLFTVVFYRVILGTTYSKDVYISLVPLTAGVMLACRLSLEFNNLVGLVCALASMLVFVTQNVFTKKILFSNKAKQQQLGNKEGTKQDDSDDIASSNSQKLDKINILFYSSTMAAICMIPIWLYAEGLGLMFSDESGVYHHATGHSSGFWSVSWLLFLNGVSHFFQNIFAFSVLALTSPVTYSIASLIKRIVVIVASIVYFHQTLGTTQWTGVCLTFWGLWLYNSAKNAAKVHPSGGILGSTAVGRRVSRNFGGGSHKGGFIA